ncbi:MAG: HK97 family phage prohead protease [Paludibacteraceae bacterium]|nr:HK97 family phage prohead protease [Paludibacteraceae bacterium]
METELRLSQREVFTPRALSVREDRENKGVIEGVAIVTNQETVLYECAEFREVEVIDPSCLNEAFLREQDIKLNLLHDRKSTIARTPDSLRIVAREDGLHFEADIPDCDLGKRAKALIANGTYTGCSFEFYAKDYSVQERTGADGKQEYVIRHTAFEKITALTVAMDPAYETTSVSARELYLREQEKTPVETQTTETTKTTAGEAHRQVGMQAPASPVASTAGETPASPVASPVSKVAQRDRQIAAVRRETEMLNCN